MQTNTHSSSLYYSNASAGNANFERLESGVAIVRLGTVDEKFISLTEKRLKSLKSVLETLKSNPPKGIVLIATAPEMFCVGADVNLISRIEDPKLGEEAALEGQAVFDLLSSMPCPTVAAISGPCVGGGCEMVLACSHRIITDRKSSSIGLPEVKLGILPGFGGTQRLPRLVGLPKALDIILAGKTLYPKQAKACGLVDEVVSWEGLLRRAEDIAAGKKKISKKGLKIADWLLTKTKLGRSIVAKKARPQLIKQTKGFYPAPPAALEAVLYGLENGMEAGLLNEAKELGRLITTPESKGLVHVYFLTEAAKAIGKTAKNEVEKVQAVIIGAGVMGAGIAAVMAKNDCSVIIKDTQESALTRAKTQVKNYLAGLKYLSESERSFLLNRIETITKTSTNIGNCNIAIEAIVEDISAKKAVLNEMAQQMPLNAIVATNTSSLSVTEIAKGITNPDRVIGMHFFNPVEKMPLVEIIRADQTSDKTICMVAALATKLGKLPIIVNDVPGFLVNRILVPYLNEAAFLLQDGYSIQAIDSAAAKFGMPMGPIRLLDEVGLDIAVHVGQTMLNGYGERMRAPDFCSTLVKNNKLGKKNSNGFYLYSPNQKPQPDPKISEILNIKINPALTNENIIIDRLILNLANEAVKCLDEGVAGKPGLEAAKQIDLGTVMGIGFPPFHGGLIAYIQRRGLSEVIRKLKEFEKSFGARFSPAEGLERRLKDKKNLYE
jgi:3-hydroxyacyl-CoA dehydrogenase/enoyl-CoA hydratase/3-hydroxybutyryl-CoA epimerase